jgi:hypothetical protein
MTGALYAFLASTGKTLLYLSVPYLYEYKVTLHGRRPQLTVFRKMPTQNVFKFVYDYKVTSSFSDNELGISSHLAYHHKKNCLMKEICSDL